MDYHFESDIQKMTLKKLSRMFKETSQLKVYIWFFYHKKYFNCDIMRIHFELNLELMC